MDAHYRKLGWQESHGGVTVDCSLDIAVHPADSSVILLTVPGLDGSVNGYQDKYIRIAERIQEQHGAAVVRMSNPFISSFHWESNIRRALEYIEQHAGEICGHGGSDGYELRIMAHSAGAAVIARIAWEYPCISRLLLINPATKLGLEEMRRGLAEHSLSRVTILIGSLDPAAVHADGLTAMSVPGRLQTVIVDGADHNFSGDAFPVFLDAPHNYLFS